MPVRSLNSRIVKWPDRLAVEAAIRSLLPRLTDAEPRLRALGYFGSYARNEWGVGSDVDLIAVLDVPAGAETPKAIDLPWARDIRLPVAHDLFLYSMANLQQMQGEGTRFARMLATETVWVYGQWPGKSELGAA